MATVAFCFFANAFVPWPTKPGSSVLLQLHNSSKTPQYHFLGKCVIPLSPFTESVTDYINLSIIDFKMLTVKINYKLKILSFYS